MMTTHDPMIEQRAYTPQETGYMRQHQPSPYSTFDEPSATPPAITGPPSSQPSGDTVTTTTTWTFPGENPDYMSQFPGMDEMMATGQGPY